MPRSNFVVDLVNTFNLNNYFSDRVNTNFTVEGRKIVGLFSYGTDVAKYLRGVGEEIIKQQYLGKEVVAGRYYDLNCFPFVLGANPSKKESDIEGVMKVELADSANKGVIRNLKIHLVNEFRVAVTLKVIARLVEEARITEEEGHEWVGDAVKIGAFDGSNPLRKDYLYCIAFDGEYFEREGYDSETFELFKGMYIQEFNSRLEECGLKNSDFYHYKDDMLYIKDVDEKVVKRVAKYVKERVALSFDTPGKEDSKIENLKDVLGSLIFKWTGKSIGAYGYDIFTDEREREDGNGFALIPLIGTCNGQLETLKRKDMYEINAKHKNLISDIKGKTAKPDVTNCKSSVYAISNKGIAQLLPEIMQFPIAYNKRFEHFEFAADLGPSSSLGSPRHVSSVSSPVPLLQPGTEETVVAVPGDDSYYPLEECIVLEFIDSLPLNNNEESKQKILPLSSSHEGRQKLYSILSSFCDRDGLYSELHLSREQRNKMEEKWRSLLHQFEESLSASSEGLAGLTLGGPRCRNSVASKDSKDSAYYTEPPTSRRSSVGSVGSSYEDNFPRNSLQASLISKSSTESSVSSNASVGTVIEVEHDPGLPNGDIDNEKEPSAKLSQMKLGSPQRDQGKELKRSPRLESEEGGLQSSGYQLPTQLSFTKVSGSQSQQSVSAAYNVQAGTNTQPQQMNPWLQQGTHENKWSQSGHSSRTSAWSQPMDLSSLPALSGYIPGFLLPIQVDSRDTPLTEKEEELIKALLYAFNLNNYILECPNTNFIVENGKIASSINDDVNVEEYLQELRDYTIKEYCGTEEEAKEEGYDLNQFPFTFLSSCETNQETKVVANISRGALLNLKKLFIRHEQGVKIEGIDINTVEKAVEFQKNSWVDSQVKGGYCNPQAAIESCYPDESVLKDIPIIKGEDGYYLDRIYGTLEVESFMEKRLHAKDTSKAEKMKPEDNKDSGYSSEPVTDAEKGEKSPKRRSQSPLGNPSLKRATPDTAAFVLDSVSHVKSNIDKLGEDFSGAIKVTEEGKFGSSKLESRHQWLDRERHRRSTKQATEEESISNWVWE